MATYKDRGYGTTIDNYKQQQEKKRKEEEAKKGPDSTRRLTLPKAEAPVSTQRMGTVNNRASSASNLRDKGFPSSIQKQEEFNRKQISTETVSLIIRMSSKKSPVFNGLETDKKRCLNECSVKWQEKSKN